jgi:molybdopterin converting factor small subunit
MAKVHVPAPLRTLTDGQSDVEADGATLGELIDRLDEKHPGIRARLVEEGRLRPGMAAFIDGVQSTGLQTKLNPDSEVYFSPAISGG